MKTETLPFWEEKMKDLEMTEITTRIQALVDKANTRLPKMIRDAQEIEKLVCQAAEVGEATLEDVAKASDYLSGLYTAKAAGARGHGAFLGVISVKSGGT